MWHDGGGIFLSERKRVYVIPTVIISPVIVES